ncbi:MAG: sigma-70 family RNA polymerase sigma factor [Candidatus Omnitrophica bacterium]|nr:sigma-70 family RNA polymerase sigma factor [Candidatus Omnitrophota bacterium]
MDKNFEGLVKRISPTLKRITYRLNGHFSFFNDEDLFQEALIHLWVDFQENKLQDKTDSYILQGCHFHLKNYLRKVKPKIKTISLELLMNDEEDRNSTEALLLEGKGSQSDIDNLNNKLLVETIRNNGFDRREKDILSFYSQGLTTRAIGQRLGISHVRVIKLMHRIKDKCRKYAV